MTSAGFEPKRVKVDIHEGKAGLFYATSDDIPGLLVAEQTLRECLTVIPKAIEQLYAACDQQVAVKALTLDDYYKSGQLAVPYSVQKVTVLHA